MEIMTDALKEVGIPKGTNVYARKVKKWNLEQPTAWRMSDGQIRITCAFEDSDNVILYSPKDANLMEIFHKTEIQFLGRVMCVKTGAEVVPAKKTCSIEIKTDMYLHLGLKPGYRVVVAKGQVKAGKIAAILVLATQKVYLGFISRYEGKVYLTLENKEDADKYLFDKSEIEILGKPIGYRKPGNTKLLPLNIS